MAKYTVISAIKAREYKDKYGDKVSWMLALKDEQGNEVAAQLSQKPETPQPSGELYGTIEETDYGPKFRKESPPFSGGTRGGGAFSPKDTASIENQVCLKASVEFMNGLGETFLKKGAKLEDAMNMQLLVFTSYKRFLAGSQPLPPQSVTKTDDTVQAHPEEDEEIDLESLPFGDEQG